MSEQLENYYGTGKVANMFGVKTATIRKWIKDGKLEAVDIGGRHRIPHSAVVKLSNKLYGEDKR